MFAHLGVMLGLCCHILAPCWTMFWAMLDHRVPPEVFLGYVVFMASPSFPKFCLKKLSPVACEAPTPCLQHQEFYHILSTKRLPRVGRGGFPTHHESIWIVLGSCWELILETLHPVASEVALLSLRSIFSPKPCGCLGRALQKCALNLYVGPSWGYVGPSGVYVGGHVRPSWGYVGASCCHILAPCWTMFWAMLDRRVLPEVIWGYVVFMTSLAFLKFCLKRLSPVACEAPTSFLQHYFFEKAESCWGRAHPRWAPEGSHQWPARFQETLPEGRKKGRRYRAASR